MEALNPEIRPTGRSHHHAGLPAALAVSLRLLARVSPALGVRVLGRLWQSAPRARVRPSRFRGAVTRRLPSALGEFVVHSLPVGDRRVYLLHGWGGRADQLADIAHALAARGLAVHAVDAPAHGEAPGRRSSAIAFSAALRGAIAAQGPAHAVITHSMGALALGHALQSGLEVDRVVLIAPPEGPREFFQQFAAATGVDARLARLVELDLERRLGFKWEQFDLADVAPQMRGRLLVIHDRDDDEVSWRDGAAVAREWPGGELMETSGLGHRGVLRDAKVIEAIAEFVG
jgi:predicted alpha/beta hydrolase family esterase